MTTRLGTNKEALGYKAGHWEGVAYTEMLQNLEAERNRAWVHHDSAPSKLRIVHFAALCHMRTENSRCQTGQEGE